MTKVGLIDVHCHFAPRWYVELAQANGHPTPDGMPEWPMWEPGQHLDFMAERGIEKSLLSLSSPGVALHPDLDPVSLARRVNEYGAELTRAEPARFGSLASLPLPDVDASLLELDYALTELGCDGIILPTNTEGVYVTDDSHRELWAELEKRQCVVLLHPTSPPEWASTSLGLPRPMMEFLFDTTRVIIGLAMSGTLSRYPKLRLVIPHSGALVPPLLDRAALFQFGMRMALKSDDPALAEPGIIDAVKRLWWDLAGTPTGHHIAALTQRFGTDRIVYGSDFCFTPSIAVDLQIGLLDQVAESAGLASWREVTVANAARLIRREKD